jgi:hypothetical protein
VKRRLKLLNVTLVCLLVLCEAYGQPANEIRPPFAVIVEDKTGAASEFVGKIRSHYQAADTRINIGPLPALVSDGAWKWWNDMSTADAIKGLSASEHKTAVFFIKFEVDQSKRFEDTDLKTLTVKFWRVGQLEKDFRRFSSCYVGLYELDSALLFVDEQLKFILGKNSTKPQLVVVENDDMARCFSGLISFTRLLMNSDLAYKYFVLADEVAQNPSIIGRNPPAVPSQVEFVYRVGLNAVHRQLIDCGNEDEVKSLINGYCKKITGR